jgi:hypothetical protein
MMISLNPTNIEGHHKHTMHAFESLSGRKCYIDLHSQQVYLSDRSFRTTEFQGHAGLMYEMGLPAATEDMN